MSQMSQDNSKNDIYSNDIESRFNKYLDSREQKSVEMNTTQNNQTQNDTNTQNQSSIQENDLQSNQENQNQIAWKDKTPKQKFQHVVSMIIPDFNIKTFSFANIMFLIIYEIIVLVNYGAGQMNWLCNLHYFGASYGPSIIQDFEIYRLITSGFLHMNFWHIFNNLLCLVFFTFTLEKNYGIKKYVILYFGSAIGGNLLSIMWNYIYFTVGASTSIFGVFAFYCIYLYDNRKKLQFFLVRCGLMAYCLISNIIYSFTETNIDGAAHLGGFIFGGLIGLIYMKDSILQSKKIAEVSVYLVIAGLAIAFAVLAAIQSSESTFSKIKPFICYV